MAERVTLTPPPFVDDEWSPSPPRGEELWAMMLKAAVAMGLTPEVFWRLSWREWRMLTGDAAPRLARTEFEALMARFPDGGR